METMLSHGQLQTQMVNGHSGITIMYIHMDTKIAYAIYVFLCQILLLCLGVCQKPGML